MYFHIDEDAGAYITGWLITDNPGEVPDLTIRVPDRKDFTLAANFFRPDLRDLGMHATGQAGFLIDHRHLPDLPAIKDISIIEPESGLTIYRRFDSSSHIERKLLFIDASGLPQIKMIRHMMTFFTQPYPLAERLSLETVGGLLSLTNIRSVFVTGSVNWPRHGSTAREREFLCSALLRDPFEELAEKLLFLTQALKQAESVRLSPAVSRYSDVLPYLVDVDLDDSKSILSVFRKLPAEVRRSLRSPMTTVFGTAPDEQLQRRNVSVALDNLAQMDVVGIRTRFTKFGMMLDESIGAPLCANCELSLLPGTEELAQRLNEIGIIEDLLDEDIALYSYVIEALDNALGPAVD